MMVGEVRKVVVCTNTPVGPSDYGSSPLSTGIDGVFCVAPQGGGALLKTEVIETYVLSPAAQVYFEQSLQPLDYEACAYLFSFGLSTVVALYLVSKYVGEIVGFIRTAIR